MESRESVCLRRMRKNSPSLESAPVSRAAWLVLFLVLYIFSTSVSAKGEGDQASTHSKLFLSSPPKETFVNTGKSAIFEWEVILSHRKLGRLRNISFGTGDNGQIVRNLITVKATRVGNNTLQFDSSSTRHYGERLRWTGRASKFAFEMANVTKEDTNIYTLKVTFEARHEPIEDTVGLVVQFPPEIVNQSSTLKQVRLPEGESVDVMCDVISSPVARVTWFKDAHVLQNDTRKHALTLRHAQLKHTGIYECVATNELGRDTYQILVIVTSCPHFGDKIIHTVSKSDDGHGSNTLISMIAPAAVFLVIFSAYLFFKCPPHHHRERRRKCYRTSKGTSTRDEQTTNLLAEWSQFSDRGEKI